MAKTVASLKPVANHVTRMPTMEACRREIETLHAFFIDWYGATVDRDAFGRLADALAPEFTMITPEGSRQDRETVLEWVRGAYGRDASGTFDIEIRNVDQIASLDDHALVRYEEWQRDQETETGRVSTVLLREASPAPEGLHWVDLHETLVEGD